MRKDYFFIGLSSRLFMLLLFIILNQYDKYNDASEIIFKAFLELFDGRNPYSTTYLLEWGSDWFSQPFNYGPITLFLLIPAMILPYWYHNLWIGMYIMINIYCFLIAEYVSKIASRDLNLQNRAKTLKIDKDPRENRLLYYGGIFFWLIPVATTCVTVFIYAPIFLAVLAFGERKHPFLSGLLISMAALSYQLVFLFVPVYFIYFFKQGWKKFFKFLIGWIPALLILLFFILWQYPSGTIESLFLYSSEMPYNKCPQCENDFDNLSVFSIPRLLYNFSNGQIQIGNEARIVMVIILGIICLLFLFSKRYNEFPELFMQWYFVIAVFLFTLTTNYGQSHYIIFLIIPTLYINQMRYPDFHKSTPIGAGIWKWEDHDYYVRKYNKLPL